MCGICGKWNFEEKNLEERLLHKMTSTLAHRGPDDEGVYVNGNIGLGHRRLSIIDLSPAAHQPMPNEDGTAWIVFNGEIYNFLDLKKGLLKNGHAFRSNSDTEVILHLYEEEGVECLTKLRGMFAFAIWHGRNKTLFLARDRIGKKPLFYYFDKNCFVFASEAKAILADPSIAIRPDPTAIHHYLTYQSVPAPFSAFCGIKKLPPAHYLTCRDGRVEVQPYWKLSYLPKFSAETAGEKKALEVELVERIQEAVKIRLISDVPLGALLSGGIDSSIIVALMSQMAREPVKTFSIGFEEKTYDELRYARIVSERFGTDHVEFRVRPDALEVLPKLVWHYNEPFADPSAIPTYYVSRLAGEHVTVVLNGDGGDESFAGYDRYVANDLAMHLDRIPEVFKKTMVPAIVACLPSSPHTRSVFWEIKKFGQGLAFSPELRNANWLCHFSNEMKKALYTEDFQALTGGIDAFDVILDRYAQAEADHFTDRTLFADVTLYLTDTLLVKMDIASMANSLEARSPFLDHELMEFVARIPAHLKLRGRETKRILKKAFRHLLPKEILARKKMGFGVPIDYWFRNELKEMVYDTLLGPRCIQRGYFNKTFIRQLLDEHVSEKWNWQYPIYNLLMLELWHQAFIDQPGPRR